MTDDFEAWARIAAAIHRLPEGEARAILVAEGVAAEWAAGDASWCRRIVDQIGDGDMELAFRFSQLCADEASARARRPRSAAVSTPEPSLPSAAAPPPAPAPSSAQSATRQMAASAVVAGGSWGRGDFRAQLGVPQPPSARPTSAPGQSHDDLRRDLNSPLVVAPSKGLDRTADATPHEAAAIRSALAWPVESWAHFHNQLRAHPGHENALWAQHGLTTSASRTHVQLVWQRRLAQDAALSQRWRQLTGG